MLVRTTDAVYEIEDGFFRRETADVEEGWRTFDAKADVRVGRPLRFYWADGGGAGQVRVWTSTAVVEILAGA
jgi:hypothetical protein